MTDFSLASGHAQDHQEYRVLGKADMRWNLDHVVNAVTNPDSAC